MIQSFGDADTAKVWRREHVRRFGSDLQRIANRKLLMIDAAETLNDLRVPPGNRQHYGGRPAGQTALGVRPGRICFSWADAGPTNVEITDYH